MRYLLAVALAGLVALPVAAQQRRAPAQPPQRELTVQNQGELDIHELYASPTTDDQWGPDRLGDRILAAGSSFRIRFGRAAACAFDVRVVYEDGRDEEVRNHDACRQPTLALAAARASPGARAGEERGFALTNRHARTIFQVFVDPGDDDDWGDDLLGSETLDPGDTARIAFRGGCVVRLRIVFDNGAAEERGGIDVCGRQGVTAGPGWTTVDNLAAFGGGAPVAPGGGGGFTLVNRSGRGVLALYVFADGSGDPGPDRLGADMVADGARFEVPLERDGQCRFTVRVVYEDSTPDQDLAGIDLCATDEVVIGAGEAGVAGGAGARVRNGGSLPIVELYIDVPGAPRGADRLGAGIIAVGADFAMSPPVDGQCDYRVTGVFRDGREVAAEADLCAGGEVVLQ